jgi:hypothetical protein
MSEATEPNKGGRPRKLSPNDQTLKELRGLAAIMATEAEVAAFFGVVVNTLKKFFDDYPEALAAFEDGKGQGRVSLRRKQFALADKNAAMAIFLGKNYLEQTDRQELTGPAGGPITYRRLDNLTLEELEQLDRLSAKISGGGDAPAEVGDTGGDREEAPGT